jgi:hypothetical protein
MHMPSGGMHMPSGGFGGGAGFGSGSLADARPSMGNLGGTRPGGVSFAGSPLGGTNLGGRGPTAFSPGGGLGHQGFPGVSAGGFDGNRERPGAIGGPGRPGASIDGLGRPGGGHPSGKQLGSFLGLPSDGGLHGGLGNHIGGDQRGHQRHPTPNLARHADLVRRDFRARGFYTNDWYRRYPGAWYPGRWAYGTVWAVVTWDYLNGWFGYGNQAPIYYDYGNTVVYQDNSVYVNGQDVGTSDEYYQQAEDLASTGATAQTTDDEQWLPLGVFAMSHDQQTKANLILQLAVNKAGIIRGNYTATLTNDTQPVQGSVDKNTQRAAWTIGSNKDNVIETGIYNLTKDEAPCLVHFGKDKTEQWILVRLKNDQTSPPATGNG